MSEPILQVALDFLELDRALGVAEEAVAGGARWIEAGTPLIKSEGLDAVRELRNRFPEQEIVADMKVMDAGRVEMEAAAKAGADVVLVLGAASDTTIEECVRAGENYGFRVGVDLINLEQPAKRAREAQEMGADYVSVHIPIDDQMQGILPMETLAAVREAVDVPVAVAGGINSETAGDLVREGAHIIVVGGAIIKSEDAEQAAEEILRAMETGEAIETELYNRVTGTEEIRDLLHRVSTPNISDALHRGGELRGIETRTPGQKVAGPAVTVRTYPGDWAKPVEAIAHAEPGSVLVIDAGGVPPAVWGELATESCLQKDVRGVVIHGGLRDVDSVTDHDFAAFSSVVTPTAGEPKGFGEINVPIEIGGQTIQPGDWVAGDDNGVVIIPEQRLSDVANRAMDVLEKENRIRREIQEGDTLAEVQDLVKWEKQIVDSDES